MYDKYSARQSCVHLGGRGMPSAGGDAAFGAVLRAAPTASRAAKDGVKDTYARNDLGMCILYLRCTFVHGLRPWPPGGCRSKAEGCILKL